MSCVHSQDTKTSITYGPRGHGDFVGLILRAPRGLLDLLLLWQQRASERSHLASLSEHHLKDLGVRRADIELEASKPFWRG